MVYSIYTDGACNTEGSKKLGVIASGYIIRTDDSYISMDLHAFNDPGLARVAESLAIALAVEDLMDSVELQPKDRVKIYSDCLPVIKAYRGAGKPGVKRPYFYDQREILTWDLLCKLRSKCAWNFSWIQAHTDDKINGNKVADRLAKYALKFGGDK